MNADEILNESERELLAEAVCNQLKIGAGVPMLDPLGPLSDGQLRSLAEKAVLAATLTIAASRQDASDPAPAETPPLDLAYCEQFASRLRSARFALADARLRNRHLARSLELARAEAEQAGIERGEITGKNAEDRARSALLYLHGSPGTLCESYRNLESECTLSTYGVEKAQAALESIRDERRDYENDLHERQLEQAEAGRSGLAEMLGLWNQTREN